MTNWISIYCRNIVIININNNIYTKKTVFTKVSFVKNLKLETDLKIILLDYQNNYVGRSS